MMNDLEVIDKLCAIIGAQADIIREQALFIDEHLSVDEEAKKTYADKRSELEGEIHNVNRSLRNYDLELLQKDRS